MQLPNKPVKIEPSPKSDSMPSSGGMDNLAKRYPWVKPEVWETPMTPEESKRFIAGLEETLRES